LRYTVLMEPIASDAIFVAPRLQKIHDASPTQQIAQVTRRRPGYLMIDKTGSVFNPFHNDTKVRYEAISLLPIVPPAELRVAAASYPDIIRALYLQLPQLDRASRSSPSRLPPARTTTMTKQRISSVT